MRLDSAPKETASALSASALSIVTSRSMGADEPFLGIAITVQQEWRVHSKNLCDRTISFADACSRPANPKKIPTGISDKDMDVFIKSVATPYVREMMRVVRAFGDDLPSSVVFTTRIQATHSLYNEQDMPMDVGFLCGLDAELKIRRFIDQQYRLSVKKLIRESQILFG